jgi:hypothetical protein
MTKRVVVTVAAVSLALTATAASAFQCPTLIKQGKDAAATMKADDPKVKQATAKLDEAQKLHSEGKHAESVKTANDALAMLGVKK